MERSDTQGRDSTGGTTTSAERRLAELVRLSPDAILVVRDGRIEFANPSALVLFGVAREDELLGRSPLRWIHPDDHPRVSERLARLTAGEAAVPRTTLTIVQDGGGARRAEGASSAFEDSRGRAIQVVLRDVTARERIEAELRDAHRHFAEILESITDGFFAVDAAWRLTYVNRRAEAAWKRPREQLLGQGLWDLFPDARGTEGAAALHRAMEERTPIRLETRSRLLDRWVETFAYPAAGGGLAVLFQDIGDRKEAEAGARESERRALARAIELQTVLDTVPAAVWISHDRAGDHIESNCFGAELLRHPLGANASTTAPPGEGPTHYRLMRGGRELAPDERPVQAAARHGAELRDVEIDLVFDDGTTRHLLGNATPIADASGAPAGAVAAFIDVTERRQEQHRLWRLAEALPQLVWSADAAGTPDWFNQRWRDYTGQAAGAERFEGVLHPEDQPAVEALWCGALARQAGFEVEHRLRRADGEYRWFLRRAVPLRDGDGAPLRWFATCTDVHDLKCSQEILRQADRLKEDFLHMASHEFRTPMTALRLQVELLRRNLRSPAPALDRVEHQLSIVDTQIDRMQALLGTLLDVSRLNAGKFTLDLADVDLADLAREAADRAAGEAQGRETPITVRAEPVIGHWDRMRLDQVVTNLLANALKYGSRRPVEVEVEARGREAILRVRDHGIGIAPESLALIFERFERAANAGAVQGMGLGLWIARKMVEAHGGTIAVESTLGSGSTFTVTLPRG